MISLDALNDFSSTWAITMLGSIIDTAVLLIVVGALWLCLRKRVSAQVGYCLFMIVIVKAMIPFEVTGPRWLASLSPRHQLQQLVAQDTHPPEPLAAPEDSSQESLVVAETTTIPVTEMSSAPEFELAGTPVTPAENFPTETSPDIPPATIPLPAAAPLAGPLETKSLSWQTMLMGVWAGGCLVMIAGFARVQLRFRRRLKNATEIPFDALPVDVDAICRSAGVRRPIRFLAMENIGSPAIWGLRRPTLLLPSDFASAFSPAQLRWILLHEFAHVHRGDLWISLLQRFVQIVHFFNPVVWIANRTVNRLREYACDDAALTMVEAPRRDCGEAFLRAVERANTQPESLEPALGIFRPGKLFKQRLLRILDTNRRIQSRLTVRSALGLLLIAALVLPCVRAADEREADETAAVEETKEEEKKPKDEGPKFIAKLPDGGTVELIGVSAHPSRGRFWWRADGSSLGRAPYAHVGGTFDIAKNMIGREFALRFSDISPEDRRDAKIKVVGAYRAGDWGAAKDQDGNSLTDFRVTAGTLPQGTKQAKIRIDVPASDWELFDQRNGNGASSGSTVVDGKTIGVTFMPAQQNEKGVSISFAHGAIDKEIRVIAIEKDGKTKHTPSRLSQLGSIGFKHVYAEFANLKLEDVEFYRIEVRKHFPVIFENVSIMPGHRTDVKVTNATPVGRKMSTTPIGKPAASAVPDARAILGKWKLVAASPKNESTTNDISQGSYYIFREGGLGVTKSASGIMEFNYTLHSEKNPKEFVLTIKSKNSRPVTFKYELDGDRLKLAFSAGGQPVDFDPAHSEKMGTFLFVLARDKEEQPAVKKQPPNTSATGWGSITGQFVFAGDIPKPKVLVEKGDKRFMGSVAIIETIHSEELLVDPKTKGVANVFVYLRRAPAIHPDLIESKTRVLEFVSKGMRFVQHAMLVRTDQQVIAKNANAAVINVHTNPVRNPAYNVLVDLKKGVSVPMRFQRSERIPFKVICDFHPWMRAHWLVLDHPYAAITDKTGKFTIKNLPAGKHNLIFWHENLGYINRKYQVIVEDGKTNTLAPLAIGEQHTATKKPAKSAVPDERAIIPSIGAAPTPTKGRNAITSQAFARGFDKNLVAVLGEDRARVWGWPQQVVVGDKGRRVFLTETNGNVAIFDSNSLRRLGRFRAHDKRCLAIALAGEGKRLITISIDGSARLWNVSTKPPTLLDKHQVGKPGKMTWLKMSTSKGGKLVALRSDEQISLVEIRDDHFILKGNLPKRTKLVPHPYALSPNGRWLVTCETLPTNTTVKTQDVGIRYHDTKLVLWDVRQKAFTVVSELKCKAVNQLVFHPDSRGLFASDPVFLPKRQTHFWSVEDGELRKNDSVPATSNAFTGAVFTDDGSLMAGSKEDGLEVFGLESGKWVAQATLNSGPRTIATFIDGQSLLAVSGAHLQRWDLVGNDYKRRNPPTGHSSRVADVLFDAETNSILTAASDNIREWKLPTSYDNDSQIVGTTLPYSGVQKISPWPDHKGVLLLRKVDGRNIVESLSRSGGRMQNRFQLDFGANYREACWCAAMHPSNEILATGHWDNKIRIWDCKQNPPKQIAEWKAHIGHVCDVAFSPDGRKLASVGWDRLTKVWIIDLDKIQEEEPVGSEIGKHAGIVRTVTFSADGKYLASGSRDGQILLQDLSRGEAGAKILVHAEDPAPNSNPLLGKTVGSLQFSRNGTRLLSADGKGRVTIWSVPTGRIEKKWQLPGWIWQARFSPDESLVATANNDGTVYLLRAPSQAADTPQPQ